MNRPAVNHFTRWLEQAACTDRFREFVEGFSSTFDFPVFFYTRDGRPLEISGYGMPPCAGGCADTGLEEACKKSIACGAISSMESGKTLFFRCFCGAGFLAVPVVIGGKTTACVVCGQFLLRRYTEEELKVVFERSTHVHASRQGILARFGEIPVVDGAFIGKMKNRLVMMAAHVGKMYQRDELEMRELSGKSKRTGDERDFESSLKLIQARDLRSQLNPHFLFNTLNAISQLAMLEGAGQTQELTYQLSEYLRYVLRKQSRQELVPLSLEMECIERYLEIYRIRFRDRLTYELTVEKGAEKAEIPFMLLQPLVENAVLHGIEPSLERGFVGVAAMLMSSSVVIAIKDNGTGCDPERIRGGIGLQNVRDRLSLHYGISADFDIRSRPKEGTSVLVRIPFEGV